MNNMPQTLLAKSKKNGEVTLQKHLFDAEAAAGEIFRLDKRFGENWCRFFKIDNRAEQEKFLLHLRIAALFHDIGKANEDFQNAVETKGYYQQTIRHEHLSALILHLREVREWLRQNPDLDLEVITAAVLSHHLKASDKQDCQWKWGQPKGKFTLSLYDQHDEINAVLDEVKKIADLPNQIRLSRTVWEAEKSPWVEAHQAGFIAAVKIKLSLVKIKLSLEEEKRRRLLLAVKAGVIVADAAASGLVRVGLNDASFIDWIKDKTGLSEIEEGKIDRDIISRRAKEIFGECEPKWSDFQNKSATLGDRALLLAACGSGKTIAAWKWAEAQAHERKIGRVIFLYPTRGTATEGFKDYVGYAPEAEASLMHGASKYELVGIAKNPNDATRDKTYQTEIEERLFALGFWGKRYFSATVDQFLSFLEHNYSSLCLLPVLADSAVIIDEIHSFDKRMFENLICFLKNFDVPVLCMTATLPTSRRKSLEAAGLRVYPNENELEELKDLKKAENHERYNLEFADDEDAALEIAVSEYNEGKRVLWVVNTVRRCQSLALKIKKRLKKNNLLVYHSRFTLEHRQKQHSKTVEAFKQREVQQIAVTTQVCEMSLDLDADVLITEFAPIPSLVQRFGRSNRNLKEKEEDFRGRLIAYNPKEYKVDERYNPYTKEEIKIAEEFLKVLPPNDITQRLLAEELKKYVLKEKIKGEFAPFLSSGYFAVRGDFRDIEEFTSPCILSDDIGKVKECLDKKEPYDAFLINVPTGRKKDETPIWILDEAVPSWLPKHLKIADSGFYLEQYGFVPDKGLLDALKELEETDE